MRIAQVAPLFESVPPRLYGGTERVVHWLTEELVAMGHEVTLFASGDSRTSARLVACCPRGLRLDRCVDPIAHHVLMLERIAAAREQFDIVHFHCDHLHFPLSRHLGLRQVTTLHGRLDLPDLPPLYDEFKDMPVISISDAQRRPLPQAKWVGTVHHGMPLELLRPGAGDGGYLAFLGRISPEKRPDRAIDIAARAGWRLRLAAKVDAVDRRYFEERIAPLLSQPHVDFIGEIGDGDKATFLGAAAALLVPIDWPEPFGLVMIEAMACGTPIIAFPAGSVPEIVEDGLTGFVCRDVEDAAAAVKRLPELDRGRVRAECERRFGARRMAQDCLRAYQRVLSGADHDDGHRPDPGSLLHPGHVA